MRSERHPSNFAAPPAHTTQYTNSEFAAYRRSHKAMLIDVALDVWSWPAGALALANFDAAVGQSDNLRAPQRLVHAIVVLNAENLDPSLS